MKLYNAAAPNPRRVRIFLAEKGVEIARQDMDLQAGESRTPAFLAKNSLGGTPVLELDDGTIITESVAICRYLESRHPEPALMGSDGLEAAKIEMWNRRMEIEILTSIGNIAQHTFPFFADKVKQVPEFAAAQKQSMPAKWHWLNGELADGRPYLNGAQFSVADITGMAALMLSDFVGAEVPASLENVQKWSAHLRSRPSWNA